MAANLRTLSTAIFLVVLAVASCPRAGVDLPEAPVQARLQAELGISCCAVAVPDQRLEAPRRGIGSSGSDRKPKSVGKAVMYSLLLPGLGEYYVGNKKKARYFFASEALWWLGYLSFRTYGDWKEDAFIRFAREKAGANLEGKSEDFQDWVGFYYSIDEYNTLGRVADRDRPYLVDNESNHWEWQSSADKNAYRELKNRSREADRKATFMFGLMAVTRIISAIDAAHEARVSRRLFGSSSDPASDRRFGYTLDVNPLNRNRQLGLTLYARF